jgi:glycosyltransferase involved in cell wall biosynthesis
MRSATRTRAGYRIKRLARRGQRTLRQATYRPETRWPLPAHPRRAVHNVLLVSHADLGDGGGLHVSAIAVGLAARGYAPVVAFPSRPRGATNGAIRVVTHRDAVAGRFSFPDGEPVDLVHAFTPRAAVRRVVRATRCAYVVHLEDNDAAMVDGTSAAQRDEFVGRSAGVTAVIERLLELKPPDVPGAVVWPGFEESILTPDQSPADVRRELGISSSEIVLFYNGNVHETNLANVRELYRAVGLLRREGLPAVLVRSGWNFVPAHYLPDLDGALTELSWVDRRHIPNLLGCADVLVQPGAPGDVDDYRFPSKVPEFLASGRPVVLPRTNIGLELRDGEEALVLASGGAEEIARRVTELVGDPRRAEAIGGAGRAFALRELRWATAVERIASLYTEAGELAYGRGDADPRL